MTSPGGRDTHEDSSTSLPLTMDRVTHSFDTHYSVYDLDIGKEHTVHLGKKTPVASSQAGMSKAFLRS
jgi:hypothetical protein